jgi:hypothetical protein
MLKGEYNMFLLDSGGVVYVTTEYKAVMASSLNILGTMISHGGTPEIIIVASLVDLNETFLSRQLRYPLSPASGTWTSS